MLKIFSFFFLIFLFTISSPAISSDETHFAAKTYSPQFKQFPPPAVGTPPGYFSMTKNIVNFRGEGKARFLAVDLKFMSYYQEVVGEEGWMEHLRPILKNYLDRVLRQQTYTRLKTPEGPDLMRDEILQMAREVLEEHSIYPNLLEDVFITKFVIQ